MGKIGEDLIPIDTLDESFDVTQERERAEFQRAHSDVSFIVSNLENKFVDFYRPDESQTRWEVAVKEGGRNIFLGEIDNPSIEISLNEDKVHLTAFSKTKMFWDWAKITKIKSLIGFWTTGTGYTFPPELATIQGIIEFNLDNDELPEGIFDDIQIDANISGKWVSLGVYLNLTIETTIGELFEAMAIEYNAEFYIDEDLRTLKFSPRLYIDNDRKLDISDLIIEEDGVSVKLYDDNKKDYIKLNSPVERPSIVANEIMWLDNSLSLSNQIHYDIRFLVTAVLEDGTEIVSPGIGAEIGAWLELDWLRVQLTVLPAMGAKSYKLYMVRISHKDDAKDPTPYYVGQIGDASVVTDSGYTWYHYVNCQPSLDGYEEDLLIDFSNVEKMPVTPNYYPYCYSIDAETGLLVKSVESQGDGLEIVPKLSFQDSKFTAISFFGKPDDAEMLARWSGVLSNKSRLICSVSGLDFKIGDSIKYSALQLPVKKDFVIRKAMQERSEDKTQLEAVEI
jgi:hypothetical protein